MFKVPEKYRLASRVRELSSTKEDGNNGVFVVPFKKGNRKTVILRVICSQGIGWEHCAIVTTGSAKHRVPSYDELCFVKSLFWSDEENVVQYFPPKKDHINNHNYCLHLFRPMDEKMPRPPKIMIGI